jgi:hypothetical protein
VKEPEWKLTGGPRQKMNFGNLKLPELDPAQLMHSQGPKI